jgi:predicted GNAT family acetyltransferase
MVAMAEADPAPETGLVSPAESMAALEAPLDIRHDADGGFFSVVVDGTKGYVQYERKADTLVATHTIVPSAIGGRGIAAQLVSRLFEHARAAGLKVRPQCSYVAAWTRKHPEVADLLA